MALNKWEIEIKHTVNYTHVCVNDNCELTCFSNIYVRIVIVIKRCNCNKIYKIELKKNMKHIFYKKIKHSISKNGIF